MAQLLVLPIHHELRFGPVASEFFKALPQFLHLAALLVHDFLRRPAILEEGIEPDLASRERRQIALALLALRLRFDARRREGVEWLHGRRNRLLIRSGNTQADSGGELRARSLAAPLAPGDFRGVGPIQPNPMDEDNRRGRKGGAPTIEFGGDFCAALALIDQEKVDCVPGKFLRRGRRIVR